MAVKKSCLRKGNSEAKICQIIKREKENKQQQVLWSDESKFENICSNEFLVQITVTMYGRGYKRGTTVIIYSHPLV